SGAAGKRTLKVADVVAVAAAQAQTPPTGAGAARGGGSSRKIHETDTLVMDTKLKIIEILQFILNVRMDYRITGLLSIFKREIDASHGEGGGKVGNGKQPPALNFGVYQGEDESASTVSIGDRGIDLERIANQAEQIFGDEIDLDGNGGCTFLRVLVHLTMH